MPQQRNQFAENVINTLNNWYEMHRNHPYPTNEETSDISSSGTESSYNDTLPIKQKGFKKQTKQGLLNSKTTSEYFTQKKTRK